MGWREQGEEDFTLFRELDEINTPQYDENNCAISADGLVLFWGNYFTFPPGGPGLTDVWFATRSSRFHPNGDPVRFENKQRLSIPVISSPIAELDPFITWNWPAPGSALYFLRCNPAACNSEIFRSAWVPVPPPPKSVPFIRGDANADKQIDISDAISILEWLFLGGKKPECGETADTNDDDRVDLTDAVNILYALFLGTGTIAPPNACGESGLLANEDTDCPSFAGCR